MFKYEKQLKIAHNTRRQLVKYAKQLNEDYNCRYIKQGLSGLCAIGARLLHEDFQAHGFHSLFVLGSIKQICGVHCFVISGGIIWDITATQFRYWKDQLNWNFQQPVLFCSKEHKLFKEFYGPMIARNLSITEVIDADFFDEHFCCWNEVEQPSDFNINLIREF